MNRQQTELLTQLLTALLASNAKPKMPAIKKKHRSYDTSKLSPAVVNSATERQLQRFTSVARGFNRMGIKSSAFTLQSGGSDTVRTYKGWLANGMKVKKGQHGVKGLFHVSQCEVHVMPKPVNLPADVQVGQVVV